MKIILGSDHAGFDLKEEIKDWLDSFGYEIEDVGVFSPEKFDYPLIAKKVSRRVVASSLNRGILICGSGHGMAVVANKFSGIRAINAREVSEVKNARQEGDINIVTLGGRVLVIEVAKEIVEAFLETNFEPNKRHNRRLRQIQEIERS